MPSAPASIFLSVKWGQYIISLLLWGLNEINETNYQCLVHDRCSVMVVIVIVCFYWQHLTYHPPKRIYRPIFFYKYTWKKSKWKSSQSVSIVYEKNHLLWPVSSLPKLLDYQLIFSSPANFPHLLPYRHSHLMASLPTSLKNWRI